jgi:hypothetical protein
MKKRLLFILCSIFVAANLASAQTKTLTNSDLEKYRQKRLQAEREYRENYERLGFPSPEELDRQRDQDRKEMSELSDRLRNEKLERERLERENEFRRTEIEILRSNANQNNQGAFGGNNYPFTTFGGYPFYSYPTGYFYNYDNRFRGNHGYFRGGNFYDSVSPINVYPPSGVRIGTGGVRIGITSGENRFPARIRSPR